MNLGSDARSLGRYIVDIDGSLRATDSVRVSPADLIALHGAARLGSSLSWERNGETIPLASDDRIELDETMVFFFRTSPRRRLHASSFSDRRFRQSHLGANEATLHAAA